MRRCIPRQLLERRSKNHGGGALVGSIFVVIASVKTVREMCHNGIILHHGAIHLDSPVEARRRARH